MEMSKMARKTLRSSYISTVISISLVLFMIGTLGVLILHSQKISNYVKENIQLTVMLLPESTEAATQALIKKLDQSAYVKSTAFVSREEAAEQLKTELGEDFTEFLGYNPLLASIDVKLKAEYAGLPEVNELKTMIAASPAVKEVIYQESLIDSINTNLRTLGLVILGFSALLMLIAAALINNTIRLALYSKRLLIKSMVLVGATRGFIRRPFLTGGVAQGLLGAFIANLLLLTLLWFARKEIPGLAEVQDYQMILTMIAGVTLAGMFIALVSTFFAVNKYLRSNMQELY